MATITDPATPPVQEATGSSSPARPRSFFERNHFWLRRLHSLTGVVPVGGYLVFHFWENATALNSPAQWEDMAVHARSMQLLLFLEVGLIILPILYHAFYGIFIASYTRVNVTNYAYARNRLFMWQRVTGMILLLYITYHVLTLRFGAFAEAPASYDIMAQQLRNPLIFLFYVIGIVGASFHFGNGLWTFLITWGITIGRRSQRVSQWVTTGVSVAMSLVGLWIIITFVATRGGFLPL